MARNHKVLLHPSHAVKPPPMIGASRGPQRGPRKKKPIALPRSLGSQTSAMVPAPMAMPDDAAAPARNRMGRSTAMDGDTADSTLNIINRVVDAMYIERRPNSSENDDHQRGNIAIANMYKATVRFAVNVLQLRSSVKYERAANHCQWKI